MTENGRFYNRSIQPFAFYNAKGPMSVTTSGAGAGFYSQLPEVCFFERTVSVTAAASGSITTILADSDVPKGTKCYIQYVQITQVGSGAVSGAGVLNISDSAAPATNKFASITASTLFSGSSAGAPKVVVLPTNSIPSGVSDFAIAVSSQASPTQNVGIVAYNAGTITQGAGGSLVINVVGYFAP